MGFLGSASDKESAYQGRNTRDAGLIPGWEDPMEEGNATHSSCLENPMDRGTQWATVHGATKSDTNEQLSTCKKKKKTKGKTNKKKSLLELIAAMLQNTMLKYKSQLLSFIAVIMWNLKLNAMPFILASQK